MAFRIPRLLSAGAIALSLLGWISLVQGAESGDAKGSKDHPLIKRYEGARIIGYESKEFSDFTLPLSKIQEDDKGPAEKKNLEGKHTRIIYVAPVGRSTLEVLRNYEQELKALGFNVLFSCSKGECGPNDGKVMVTRFLYPRGRKLSNKGQVTEYAFSFPEESRYLSAEWVREKGNIYVSLYVAKESFDQFKETKDHVLMLLDVIEIKPMETKMVVVPAEEMALNIDKTGRAILYGIYFDTNSTVIKPESKETLAQIQKLLSTRKDLKLYVVGHTDNVGGFDYNMDLSRRRAESVVNALGTQYGIDRNRLSPAGVGLLAPVAPNSTEEGKAKNRRVELVPRN